MMHQAIDINGLENHFLCNMQYHLNGVHIMEVPKFLAESSNVTTHVVHLTDSLDAAHPLATSFQLSSITSYFDIYYPHITEYENEDIQKIHLTADKPPQDQSRNELVERET